MYTVNPINQQCTTLPETIDLIQMTHINVNICSFGELFKILTCYNVGTYWWNASTTNFETVLISKCVFMQTSKWMYIHLPAKLDLDYTFIYIGAVIWSCLTLE